MGEIGKAIHAIFPDAETVDMDIKDIESSVDVMHICFPYSESFVQYVKEYQTLYNPKHTIIYSTVQVGTTATIARAVHSPVEGRHPDLELSIRQMTRWLGGEADECMFFKNLFSDKGISSKVVASSDYTEALKLLSTTEYGINIVMADYKAAIAEQIGMDYELAKEWNRDYNKLYRELGEDSRFQKYVLDPPEGVIGGHCVRENAAILQEFIDDDILDLILQMEGKNEW